MSSSKLNVTAQPLQSVNLPLQVGNTLQRPSSPPNGFLRVNSETNYIEVYYNNYWTSIIAISSTTIVALRDPYFMYNVLLLTGIGTNNTQNNTFLDSSIYSLTVTRVGNTTQGSFSLYGSNWSNYFNGSTDLINSSASASIQIGANDYCLEAWVMFTGTFGTLATFMSNFFQLLAGDYGVQIGISAAGYPYTSIQNGNAVGQGASVTSGTQAIIGQWQYYVAVRTGANLSLFIDGIKVGSTALAGVVQPTHNIVTLGRYSSNSASQWWPGYISNARMCVGTTPYSATVATITVPSSPLTSIAGTVFLSAQNNRFVDNGPLGPTITTGGTPSVQRFSPFLPTTPYSASTMGGSGYFDGTGDYMTVPYSANFDLSTGDWTMEAWFNANSVGGVIIAKDTSGVNFDWYMGIPSSTSLAIYTAGTAQSLIATVPTMSANSWYHYAICRTGTATRIFLNGIQYATSNLALTNASATTPTIGCVSYNNPGGFFNGYIAELRVIKGTGVYTGNFTPPIAPLTTSGNSSIYPNTTNVNTTFPASNTSLLFNFINAGIFDNAMQNNMESVGDAKITTTESKFGGSSIFLPNTSTSDYLVSPVNGQLSGNFTLEMWIYPTSIVAGSAFLYAIGAESGSRFAFYLKNGIPYLNIFAGAETALGSTGLRVGWSYLTFVRTGSTITAYINGLAVGSTTSYTGTLGNTTRIYIGSDSGATSKFKGYISNLRVTRGYARYTSNFTPPTQALPTY